MQMRRLAEFAGTQYNFPPASTMNRMRSISLFYVVILLRNAVLGYQQEVPRRDALLQAMAAASTLILVPISPAKAVLRSKGCYQGEGEACAEMSDGNTLIKSLQEKSAANRERNEKVRQQTTTSGLSIFASGMVPVKIF